MPVAQLFSRLRVITNGDRIIADLGLGKNNADTHEYSSRYRSSVVGCDEIDCTLLSIQRQYSTRSYLCPHNKYAFLPVVSGEATHHGQKKVSPPHLIRDIATAMQYAKTEDEGR